MVISQAGQQSPEAKLGKPSQEETHKAKLGSHVGRGNLGKQSWEANSGSKVGRQSREVKPGSRVGNQNREVKSASKAGGKDGR